MRMTARYTIVKLICHLGSSAYELRGCQVEFITADGVQDRTCMVADYRGRRVVHLRLPLDFWWSYA